MRLRAFGFGAAVLLAAAALTPAMAEEMTAAAPDFVGLADGQTVTSPVVVHFSIPGAMTGGHNMAMAATASHDAMQKSGQMSGHMKGHVHLVIDSPLPKPGEMVPSDGRHRHLMHGEKQTTLQLPPGDHTLQLVMAGTNHRVGTPPVASKKITIHVIPKTAKPAS